MGTIWQDMRYSARLLAKRPGFTAVAVLTLALGIGANTTIFSMVNSVLIQPLPYKDPHQLVRLYSTVLHRGGDRINMSYSDMTDLRAQSQSLQGLAAFSSLSMNFSGGSEPVRVLGGYVTPGFFEVLGFGAIVGRTIQGSDQVVGEEHVAVLTEDLWQRRFGGNPAVVDTEVILDGTAYTVVGVVPNIPRLPEVWIPLPLRGSVLRRSNRFLSPVGRLQPDVALDQARAELEGLARNLEQTYPETNKDHGIRVETLKSALVEADDRMVFFLLFGVVSFVLLIACANVANLLLARATTREKEIAIRAALGAGRGRLIRQLLTESVLLAGLGGALGLLLGYWGLRALLSVLPPYVPRVEEIRMDGWVLLYTLAVAFFTALLFGLAPALQLSAPDLHDALKQGGRTSGGRGRRLLRHLLAVGQVAVALVLLVCAGLFLKGFAHLARMDPGFTSENVLTVQMNLPRTQYPSDPQVVRFFQDVMREIRTVPGVEAVGATSGLYIGQGSFARGYLREGDPVPSREETSYAVYYATSPDYLRTLQVRLRAGRYFVERDEAEFPKIAIINETLARRLWPEEDPVGRQIRVFTDEDFPRTVVGVVADTRAGDFRSAPPPQIYVPHTQTPWASMTLAIRTRGDSESVRGTVQRIIQHADKDLPVYNMMTLERRIFDRYQGLRVLSALLGTMGVLALGLAVMGIYGVISYAVAQRTHEFGVRMALGARPGDILGSVLRQGMVLTSISIVIGLAASTALSRAIGGSFMGLDFTDPLPFAGISLLLAAVALAACYAPARRATRVDPLVALRYE